MGAGEDAGVGDDPLLAVGVVAGSGSTVDVLAGGACAGVSAGCVGDGLAHAAITRNTMTRAGKPPRYLTTTVPATQLAADLRVFPAPGQVQAQSK
ncbi:MAG: hypothetical protein HY678_12435 [Chloroflexi bacterium]|nr:hypothetical protein [Chloroflexota bacterium]